MTSRSIRFFMLTDEFIDIAWSLRDVMGVHLILARPGNPETMEMAPIGRSTTMTDGRDARWLCVAAEPPSEQQLGRGEVLVAEWGWLLIDIPRVEKNTLYMARISAKSDWYDVSSKSTKNNPASVDLFPKVARLFKKKLPHKAWGIGPEDTSAWPSNVRCSASIRKWMSNGGELRDVFSPKIRYALLPAVP